MEVSYLTLRSRIETGKVYSSSDRIKFSQRLETIGARDAKDIHSLILEDAKTRGFVPLKKLGNRTTLPYDGQKRGEDYQFDLSLFPDDLLQMIEIYLDLDQEIED